MINKNISIRNSIKYSSMVASTLVAISTIMISTTLSIHVPLIWTYPMYMMLMVTALFGICDVIWFNMHKYIVLKQEFTVANVLSSSSVVHICVYIFFIMTAISIVSGEHL